MDASTSPELRAFEAAVRALDVAAVRQILERSPEILERVNDPIFDFGQRATHVAANQPELLEFLLRSGADINLRSDWSAGPYSVFDVVDEAHAHHVLALGATLTANAASRLGWFDDLKRLVSADPQVVHERGGDGQQPLHQAKTVEIASYLLDHGADIDARCIDHHSTAAQYALAARPAVCRVLLSRGAAPDIFMAAFLGDRDLATRLVDADPTCVFARVNRPGYAPVPPFNIYCWTLGFLRSPHDVARSQGHVEVYELLVQRSPRRLRFLDAASRGDEAAVRAALDEDPSLLASLSAEEHGELALAIFFGRTEAARAMLAIGFDPAAPGTDGGSALHAACWIGSTDLVARILETGRVAVDQRDPTHGSTPLGWTAFGSVHRRAPAGDYAGVVDRLVSAGADVRAAGNRSHASLIEMASGNSDVQDALRRHGAA